MRFAVRKNLATIMVSMEPWSALVAQGMTCPQVAHLLGDAPRSVEYWVGRFVFRQLGFRLRKPRPALAHADPAAQKAHKKNSKP